MSAPAQAKAAAPQTVSLTGAEKVAVLLLALGKPRAAKLLKRFDPDELKVLTQLAGDLQPIGASDLEGAGRGVRAEVLQRHQFRRHREGSEEPALRRDGRGPVRRCHDGGAGTARRSAVAGLGGDHQDQGRRAARLPRPRSIPQTAAIILSKIEPGMAAKIVAGFPAQQRNDLLIRMLGIKKTADDAAARRRAGHCRGMAGEDHIGVARQHRRHPEPAGQGAVGRPA